MASALSRGSKHVVLSKEEWVKHPDRCTYWGSDRYLPALHTGKEMIKVIFSDPK